MPNFGPRRSKDARLASPTLRTSCCTNCSRTWHGFGDGSINFSVKKSKLGSSHRKPKDALAENPFGNRHKMENGKATTGDDAKMAMANVEYLARILFLAEIAMANLRCSQQTCSLFGWVCCIPEQCQPLSNPPKTPHGRLLAIARSLGWSYHQGCLKQTSSKNLEWQTPHPQPKFCSEFRKIIIHCAINPGIKYKTCSVMQRQHVMVPTTTSWPEKNSLFVYSKIHTQKVCKETVTPLLDDIPTWIHDCHWYYCHILGMTLKMCIP